MTVTECLIQKVQSLSPDNQEKVLRFVESLQQPTPETPRRKNPRGMFSDLGVSISLEDFEEARREAWKNFPRPFPDETDS